MPGNLYIVSTPIGNLDDLTVRAIRVLGDVGVIFAESVERTQKLLSHKFDIILILTNQTYFENRKEGLLKE